MQYHQLDYKTRFVPKANSDPELPYNRLNLVKTSLVGLYFSELSHIRATLYALRGIHIGRFHHEQHTQTRDLLLNVKFIPFKIIPIRD